MSEKRNFGALFRNSYKTKDNHPDYRGTIEINGEEYKLAGWVKPLRQKDGNYLSLEATKPEPKQEPDPHADSELPF